MTSDAGLLIRSMALSVLVCAGCSVGDADLANSAIKSFTLMPDATRSAVFQMHLTGAATFGYLSSQPATLEIQVEGATQHQSTIDVNAMSSASLDLTIPLMREGDNQITGILRYAGQEQTQKLIVNMAWDAPSVNAVDPAAGWTETYVGPAATTAVSLTKATDLVVTALGTYTVDEVSATIDDGVPVFATLGTPAANTSDASRNDTPAHLEVANPDIGDKTVVIKVIVSDDRHTLSTLFYRGLHVDAKFDCGAPATSMLPTTDIFRTGGTSANSRILRGYFGDPNKHQVTFILGQGAIITAGATWNSNVPNPSSVSQLASLSRTSMSLTFATDQLRLQCNNGGGCTANYTMSLNVDGLAAGQNCPNATFGIFHDGN